MASNYYIVQFLLLIIKAALDKCNMMYRASLCNSTKTVNTKTVISKSENTKYLKCVAGVKCI